MAAKGQAQALDIGVTNAEEDVEESFDSGYETPDGFEVFEDGYDDEENDRPVGRERAGIYLTALVALAVPSIIVLAFFLPAADQQSTDDVATNAEAAVGLDEIEVVEELEAPVVVESAPAIAVEEIAVAETAAIEPLPAPEVEVEVESVVVEAEPDVAPEPEPDVEPALTIPDFDPEAIAVTVYNQDPPVNGRVQFALRLNSVATAAELDTNIFTVEVHNDEDGLAATGFDFLHPTLPVGSSALATVQATGLAGQAHFVVVSVGDVEVASLPLNMG